MKRILAFVLAAMLLLTVCGREKEEPSSSSLTQEEKETGLTLASALTEVIIPYALSNAIEDGWHGEEELLDLTIFALCAPVLPEHPYQAWFPIEADGLRCFSREFLHRMMWEVFGVENWEFSPGGIITWNEEKERYESTVEFGLPWPTFQRGDGYMTASWQDEETITVLVPLSRAGSVNGDPGFIPVGTGTFTYRRMEEGQRDFLRFVSLEIEELETYRYNTIPGVEVPNTPVGKIVYDYWQIGHGGTITEPSTIEAVLELLGKIRILDAPADPPTDERPFDSRHQFFASPEDTEPLFTIYREPFCVEVGGQRSSYYLVDDSYPGEGRGLFLHIFSEMERTFLKYPREGKRLYQIPFRESDGTQRTINFFFPEDWINDGTDICLPTPEGNSKLLEFTAYTIDSKEIQYFMEEIKKEERWIAGRDYWYHVESDTLYPYNIHRYYFYENGYFYQIAFYQNTETMPLTAEEFEEMLWDLVYIQTRGPDEMADVVLPEQAIREESNRPQ